MRVLALFLVAALPMLGTGIASAQSVLDRVVGPSPSGGPLEFRALTAHELGSLSRAAGIPIGIESLPPPAKDSAALRPIVLTGKTVRDAVAAMIAIDSRYAWREDAGVVLFEPVEQFGARPLDAPAPPVRLGETKGADALAVAAALLGAPRSTDIHFGDTKPFVLDAPDGTIRSLLNAIVRSHGELVWIFERTTTNAGVFPYTLLFMSGPHGSGLGLSGKAAETLDVSRFIRAPDAPANILDIIVGTRGDGYPLEISGVSGAVSDLAILTRVPFGFQVAPGPLPRAVVYTPSIVATGRTLREVLDFVVARDYRYEWRVVDGTIVIRPSRAWTDGADPLFSLVADMELKDASMTQAVRTIANTFGGDSAFMTYPDSKTVSLAVFHGTALEVLTALAKAHGALIWTFEEAEPKEVQSTGLTHRLTIGVAGGGGLGFLVRIGRTPGK